MLDTTNGDRIKVSTDGDSVPYLLVPLTQLEGVKALLHDRGIDHWVEENAIALNDEPYIAVINLSRSVDVDAVQKILDAAQ